MKKNNSFNKKVVITGAGGLLGSHLVRMLSSSNLMEIEGWTSSAIVLNDNRLRMVDITNPNEVERAFYQFMPDCVIHCAAMTDVDLCESNREIARRINYDVTKNIVSLCRINNVKLIFLSTDYVFNGNNGPYTEDAPLNPINYYGLTKAWSEQYIQEMLSDWMILRTTVLFSEITKIKSFFSWVIQMLQQGKVVNAAIDQYGNPTYVGGISSAIVNLIRNDCKGIFNVAGTEWINRYEFAVKIAQVFGYRESLIHAVTSDQLFQKAPRPKYGGFNVKKVLSYTDQLSDVSTTLLSIKEVWSRERIPR